ncbi:hypothetical protein JKA74_13045 [Marivirga sp. S37H4]|uniref:Peptidase M1 membrane alanine aminopeptidase domain-containing protein n=1 Tax=Marivirga aurantiaca TaxID=2802615 RepID=A0A935CA31_9BACT|nr:M1 family aminopeptidase [Marivirga aurantiaca]MBK6265962.1 hypothetical protein [Marivirga aurantiaca]
MLTLYGLKLPDVNTNAPYMIAYSLSLSSIGCVFAITFLAASSLLRDQDHQMQELVFVTPITKFYFLTSRFLGAFIAALSAYIFLIAGMLLAVYSPLQDADKLGSFQLMNYGWNFFLFALPNMLLVSALLFFIATLIRNRMAIYLGGLAIYIGYIAVSLFSGAPWMANINPPSAEAMALAAKIDPFGISSFYAQTRYWSAYEQNTKLLVLEGSFLLNRLLYFSFSILLILFTYSIFSFRKSKTIHKADGENKVVKNQQLQSYQSTTTTITNFRFFRKSFFSLLKIELHSIYKSFTFLLLLGLWLFVIGIELFSEVQEHTRTSAILVTSGQLIMTIMDVFPVFGILTIVFYAGEQLWRNKLIKFDELNDVTPATNYARLLSKFIGLISIPLLMIFLGNGIAIALQLYKAHSAIEWGLYGISVYYLGMPLVIFLAISILVQTIIPSKYVGMAVSFFLALLIASPLSTLMGVEHQLLRFANPFTTFAHDSYSDFNGFGQYTQAFNWRMLLGLFIAIFALVLSNAWWIRGKENNLKQRLMQTERVLGKKGKRLILFSFIGILMTSGYIFYAINWVEHYETRSDKIRWTKNYELLYKPFKDKPQPHITELNATIDLYPTENWYEVKGNYLLDNKTDKPLDTVLLGIHRSVILKDFAIDGATVIRADEKYGYYLVAFDRPFLPNENLKMTFQFESGWSPFTGHEAFNAIVDNGSFLRISNYFPFFGYDDSQELKSEDLRKEEGLPERKEQIPTLEEVAQNPQEYDADDYHFIDFQLKISTDVDQQVIAPGQLISEEIRENRHVYSFKSTNPVPFRLAVASARYEVQKWSYKEIDFFIYYHPSHKINISSAKEAIIHAFDYCTENFGPYQYKSFRYVEVSDFTSGFVATSYPGVIYHREGIGFTHDLSNAAAQNVLYKTIAHEFAHQWWGGQLHPKQMEGAIVLTEGLAQYTETMIYEQAFGKELTHKALEVEMDSYLRDRNFKEEMPLFRVGYVDPHIAYSKSAKVFYALKELIGEKALNAILKELLIDFSFPQVPPTVNDFLTILYEKTEEQYHETITDLFKRVVVYDVSVEGVSMSVLPDSTFELNMEVKISKYRQDKNGKTIEYPIHDHIEIAVMSGDKQVIYLKSHRFERMNNQITIKVGEKPQSVIIDPMGILIEEDQINNKVDVQ